MPGGTHGGGACMADGVCMTRGMHGRGGGGMRGRNDAW